MSNPPREKFHFPDSYDEALFAVLNMTTTLLEAIHTCDGADQNR